MNEQMMGTLGPVVGGVNLGNRLWSDGLLSSEGHPINSLDMPSTDVKAETVPNTSSRWLAITYLHTSHDGEFLPTSVTSSPFYPGHTDSIGGLI